MCLMRDGREEQLEQTLEESAFDGRTQGATAWRITCQPNRCQLGVLDKGLKDTKSLLGCNLPFATRCPSYACIIENSA